MPEMTSRGRRGAAPRARTLSELTQRLEDGLSFERQLLEKLDEEPAFGPAELMLRLLLLQAALRLTDEELLTEVADRLSLRRFCGLEPDQPLPSTEALVAFRERVDRDLPLRDSLTRLVQDGCSALSEAMPLISVVSPVYRAEATVTELVRRVCEAAAVVTQNFEIVLVNDGSPDKSWERIEECCRADPRVRGIKLSRNFGQHSAITAGLANARGAWVVVMDCDLQDNPRYIPELYRQALAGFDIVFAVKEKREHGMVKNWLGRLFSRVFNWLSRGQAADPNIGAYSLISGRVVEAFLQLQDVHRHYLMLLRWLGFPSTQVTVRHEPRFTGRSSYSVRALVGHAVNGIVSHSDRLLYASVAAGFTFLTLSLLGILYLVVGYFQTGFQAGWTSTIVLTLLCTSMILLSVGTAGIYVGKIFEQVKKRPLYIVEEVLEDPGDPAGTASGG